MTQQELITQWERNADYLEREAGQQSNYLTKEQRDTNDAKAQVYRDCAAELRDCTLGQYH